MSSGGAGTSESASESASAGCSLSERLRPSISYNKNNRNTSNCRNNSNRNDVENGDLVVYTWGRGEDGQLGLGDTSDQDEPTYVDALRGVGVRQIACGSGHTVVLSTEGEVFTWGRGDDGE